MSSVRQSATKEGRPFVIAEVEDASGSIEVTVWPRLHETTRGLWVEGALVIVKGQLRGREGQFQVSCQQAQRYTPGQSNGRRRAKPRELIIQLKESATARRTSSLLSGIVALLRTYPGEDRVSVQCRDWLEGGQARARDARYPRFSLPRISTRTELICWPTPRTALSERAGEPDFKRDQSACFSASPPPKPVSACWPQSLCGRVPVWGPGCECIACPTARDAAGLSGGGCDP